MEIFKDAFVVQFEGFTNMDAFYADYAKVDKDGDHVYSTTTREFMICAKIKLLIEPRASKKTILRLLEKIKLCVEKDESNFWGYGENNESSEVRNSLKDVKLALINLESDYHGYLPDDVERLLGAMKMVKIIKDDIIKSKGKTKQV